MDHFILSHKPTFRLKHDMKQNNRKKLLKNNWFWITTGLLVVVVMGVGFLAPRLLYSNPYFQAWVQSQISDQTHGLFQFQKIQGGIFSAHLQGVHLDLDGTPYNVRKVEAPEIKASFAWIPLCQNKLVIHSLLMQGGQLQVRLIGGNVDQTSLPVAPYFRLKKGKIILSDLSGWTLQLQDCDLKIEQSGKGADQKIKGKLTAATAHIGLIDLKNLETTFSLEKGVLSLEKCRAFLPGQSLLKLSGSYQLSGARALETELALQSEDIQALLKALDYSDRFAGEAEIHLQAKGIFTPLIRTLDGPGHAVLKKIKAQVSLPRFPVFNDSAIIQRVRNLQDLKGKAAFHLNQSQITINDLNIKNTDVSITGSAVVGYDRSLSSSLIFTGNKTVDAEIPALARDIFQHDAAGNVIIPFELKGSTKDPQVDIGNIVGRVLGNPIKTLNPLNLFN
jgi:hypothetical protein